MICLAWTALVINSAEDLGRIAAESSIFLNASVRAVADRPISLVNQQFDGLGHILSAYFGAQPLFYDVSGSVVKNIAFYGTCGAVFYRLEDSQLVNVSIYMRCSFLVENIVGAVVAYEILLYGSSFGQFLRAVAGSARFVGLVAIESWLDFGAVPATIERSLLVVNQQQGGKLGGIRFISSQLILNLTGESTLECKLQDSIAVVFQLTRFSDVNATFSCPGCFCFIGNSIDCYQGIPTEMNLMECYLSYTHYFASSCSAWRDILARQGEIECPMAVCPFGNCTISFGVLSCKECYRGFVLHDGQCIEDACGGDCGTGSCVADYITQKASCVCPEERRGEHCELCAAEFIFAEESCYKQVGLDCWLALGLQCRSCPPGYRLRGEYCAERREAWEIGAFSAFLALVLGFLVLLSLVLCTKRRKSRRNARPLTAMKQGGFIL